MIAHVDVQIPFPIGTVWDLLTDLPRMANLSPEVESARWLTDESCVQGARFLARNRRGPLQWQVTGEVTAARPPVLVMSRYMPDDGLSWGNPVPSREWRSARAMALYMAEDTKVSGIPCSASMQRSTEATCLTSGRRLRASR